MKKLLLSLIVVLTLAILAGPNFVKAAAFHFPGVVYIINTGGATWLTGSFNVRHNPAAPYPSRIQIGSSDGAADVVVYGNDGSQGFSCHIDASSPLYQDALDLSKSATNSTVISVRAPNVRGIKTCDKLLWGNASLNPIL